MSFFNYAPKQEETVKQEGSTPEPTPKQEQAKPKMNPFRVLIDGEGLIKQTTDNPELAMGKFDIGNGMARQWQPLNYNPANGKIEEWK